MAGSTTEGLHGGPGPAGLRVDLYRVEDVEGLLADLGAQAGGAAEHLLERMRLSTRRKKTRLAIWARPRRCEQVHRDRHVWLALVLEAADQLQRLAGAP